jgi:transcriptional regulator with XRE-family HTH domain
MDPIRVGLQVRALRLLKELRQDDLAGIARLSRALVSRVERGLIENVRVGDLDRVARALGARLDVRLRWNGESLDRLLDEAHAALVNTMVALLRGAGWEVAVEVSFSIWGERGSIDILAFHPATGILLVIEVKSRVPDSQEMLATLDRKARLAKQVAAERGWEVRSVARLLVIADTMTARRRVARLASTFDTSYPVRGHAVRRWLRQPAGSISGLLFLSYAPAGSTRNASRVHQRVRRQPRARRAPESGVSARPGSV